MYIKTEYGSYVNGDKIEVLSIEMRTTKNFRLIANLDSGHYTTLFKFGDRESAEKAMRSLSRRLGKSNFISREDVM